jgi:acyl carrier protein
MSLHERLLKFLQELDLELNDELTDDTSLIKSGVLDSLSLFKLAAWVEQEIGGQVDLREFNLIEEWDTIAEILNFVERYGNNRKEAEVKG